MTKIKLCGLTRECDIEAANACCPEYIGFVFAQKSSRYLNWEEAARLRRKLLPNISPIGVFVDAPLEKIIKMLDKGIIDGVQLHGNETEEQIEWLQKRTEKPVLKAFSVRSEQDIKKANESKADYILLDSREGGTGIPFDWNLLKYAERPYFLAGGIGLNNINMIMEKYQPYGVDISSGIETKGYKDPEKMAAFVAAVRNQRKEEKR